MTTQRELMRWHLLALAIGCFPGSRVPAAELSSNFSAARVLYEERRYTEARSVFGQIAADQPDSVEVNFYLGRLALWFDDHVTALGHLEKALRSAPHDARLHNALGDAYGLAAQQATLLAKLGWARKCLAAYERAVALDPLKPAYRWSLIGYHCVAPRIAGGNCDRAFEQAEALAKLDPAGGRVARATLHLAARKTEAAFAEFDDVLRRGGDDFLALYQIGRCAALSGEQLERGAAALERCLALVPPAGEGMPTRASVHHRLGNILEKKGESAAARQHYAAALRLQPDFRAEKDTLRN